MLFELFLQKTKQKKIGTEKIYSTLTPYGKHCPGTKWTGYVFL